MFSTKFLNLLFASDFRYKKIKSGKNFQKYFWSIAKNYETNFLKKLCFEKFDGKILFISGFQKKIIL